MEKVTEFLKHIREHFLIPAQSDAVSSSCTATCLLLFSVADALGLVFGNKAGNKNRFQWTLEQLKGDYAIRKVELWQLRNSLVHEAVFTSAYLSQVEPWSHQHLSLDTEGYVFVNSRTFTKDMLQFVSELEAEVSCSSERMLGAEAQLDWGYVEIQEHSDTTPPPPFTLKYLKSKS